MRILYLHHLGELGGAPTSLLMILREMAKKEGVEFRVLCARGRLAERFRREGFDVHAIPISGFYHLPGNTYRGFRWLLFFREVALLIPHIVALRRHIKAFKPDLVHLNDAVLIPAALTCKMLDVPVVWHARIVIDYGHRCLRRRMILKIMRYAANRVIAISEDVGQDLEGVAATIIHNSVDLRRFNNLGSSEIAKNSLGLDSCSKVVAMVSRIDPVKGSYDFVKIAALVKEVMPNVKFIVAGVAIRENNYFHTFKGRMVKFLKLLDDREAVLRSHVLNYGLESDFLLLGEVAEIEKVYAAADVVVFPSYLRSISRAGLEAAASGVPSVMTTTTGNEDIILNGRTGFLVPQGDVRAAAQAIIKILQDPDLQKEMGLNARAHAVRYFDPLKNGNKIYELYRTIISCGRGNGSQIAGGIVPQVYEASDKPGQNKLMG